MHKRYLMMGAAITFHAIMIIQDDANNKIHTIWKHMVLPDAGAVTITIVIIYIYYSPS